MKCVPGQSNIRKTTDKIKSVTFWTYSVTKFSPLNHTPAVIYMWYWGHRCGHPTHQVHNLLSWLDVIVLDLNTYKLVIKINSLYCSSCHNAWSQSNINCTTNIAIESLPLYWQIKDLVHTLISVAFFKLDGEDDRTSPGEVRVPSLYFFLIHSNWIVNIWGYCGFLWWKNEI